MRDCNLTRGGFYAHFRSKSQLYRDAIALATAQRKPTRRDDDNWVELLVGEYLEAQSTVFFATDIASQVPEVRLAYTQAFNDVSAQIANRIAARTACSDATLLSLTAMIVGVIAVAHSIDDAALKAKLVASCKESAKTLLENGNGAPTFFWEPLTQHERARYRLRHSI
jgi:AcrR family transcriptional regulator